MQLNVDGEYGGKLPANFLNLKQHIEVCTLKIFIMMRYLKIIKVFKN